MAEGLKILILCADRLDGLPSGLPVHLKDLVEAIPEVTFGFLFAEADLLRLDIYNASESRTAQQTSRTSYAWPLPSDWNTPGCTRRVNPFKKEDRDYAILECVYEILKPDVINIHHLLGHSCSIYRLAESFHVPIVHSLHDYYSLTPQIHLPVVPDQESEAGAFLGDDALKSLPAIADWRTHMAEALGRAAIVTAPTQSVLGRLKEHSDFAAEHSEVVPLGLPDKILEQRKKRSERMPDATALRVGVMGTMKMNRSWLRALAEAPEQLELHYFGHVPFSYEARKQHKTEFHGVFERDQIVSSISLENLDLIVVPSSYIETFSLALSEAWCAGVPVLAPDQGAFSERLGGGGGWLYPVGSPERAGSKLTELIASPALLGEEMTKVSQFSLVSMDQTAAAYRGVWERAISIGNKG